MKNIYTYMYIVQIVFQKNDVIVNNVTIPCKK